MDKQPVTPRCVVLMTLALQSQARTYDDLVALTGLRKATVARWITALRTADRMVRIEAYAPDKSGRPFVPMFRLGGEVDLPRPGPAIAPAQRMRALRAKRKALAPHPSKSKGETE